MKYISNYGISVLRTSLPQLVYDDRAGHIVIERIGSCIEIWPNRVYIRTEKQA